MRSFAVILALALLGASPPPAAPPNDGVAELIGSWTCRNPYGDRSTVAYRMERGRVAAVETSSDGAFIANDVFTPAPSVGWTVERTSKYRPFSGYAPAWTTGPWVLTESQKHGAEIRYERLDDRTLRRTFHISGRAPYAGEVCAKGDTPPDPALCAVPDVPASVVHAVEPETPPIALQNRITGTARVLVSLDTNGNVVSAVIQDSPSVLVNAASVAAARDSTYRPALHDCKPVPSQYLYAIGYSG